MGIFNKNKELLNAYRIQLLDRNTNKYYNCDINFYKIVGKKGLYRADRKIEQAQNTDKIDMQNAKKVSIMQNEGKDKIIHDSFLLRTCPEIYKLIGQPGFREQLYNLLDYQRIRERLLRANKTVKQHYLYYRMGLKDKVLGQTMLFVGSLQKRKGQIERCYDEIDEELNTEYAAMEIERIDMQIDKIRRMKEWKQACIPMWETILKESDEYKKRQETIKINMQRRAVEEHMGYKQKHADKQEDEEVR